MLMGARGERHAPDPSLTIIGMCISFIIMAIMTIRTSVAFDSATTSRWQRLAKRWGVSKSEALRRALEAAENPAGASGEPDFASMSLVEILDWFRDHPQPPISGGWGEDPHAELRAMRERDAEIEEERERAQASRTSSESAV